MAALRTLKDEDVVTASIRRAYEMADHRREHDRRQRDNDVCSTCGGSRSLNNCTCSGAPDVWSQAPEDPGWDA